MAFFHKLNENTSFLFHIYKVSYNRGDRLKKIFLFLIVSSITCLFACNENTYEAIKVDESFVASVNIIDQSIQFFNKEKQPIAHWQFDKAITGAVLVADEIVAIYGHQLTTITMIELATGEVINKIDVPIGTTNIYFDSYNENLYVTNNKSNELSIYSKDGQLVKSIRVKNYPMSMVANEQYIYVINYKDTFLSVINKNTNAIEHEWAIPKSSHGIYIFEDELWIGGHGEGMESNKYVNIYDLHTGHMQSAIELPIMPIGVAQLQQTYAVVSHGNSMVHALNEKHQIVWEKQIGANPFAITTFEQEFVIAGYDDHSLYFVSQDGTIKQTLDVGKGPFQLIVRGR